jgi:hypothetical protein
MRHRIGELMGIASVLSPFAIIRQLRQNADHRRLSGSDARVTSPTCG